MSEYDKIVNEFIQSDMLRQEAVVLPTTCPSCTASTVTATIPPCTETPIQATGTVCNPGRLVPVTVTFNNVCPGKTIAFAVILNTVSDSVSTRIGIQFCQVLVPGTPGTPCTTFTAGTFTFPVPGNLCETATFTVQIVANFDS